MKKHFLFILALCAASAVWGTEVTKTAKTIASEQGWKTKETYTWFALDDVITCTTYGTNGYYSADSPNDWRIYQSRENGKFVISAKEGYIIKSITLTYGKKNETDIVARNCGTNIIEANRLVSGQSYAINATSVTLFSANTSTATTAQAKISQFSVVYEPICAIEEAFTNVIQTGAAGANTKWEGDYAEWNVTSVRRAGTDTLAMGIQGTWSNNDKSSAFLQTTNAEGGVKHISFIWRQWGVESGATLKMNVQVGSTFDKTSQTTGVSAAAAAPFMLFDEEVGCKENAQIKITNTSIKNTKTGRTTFRDLIITPYLRYTYTETKQVYDDESTFDCSLQIDNTDDEGTITYISDNTDAVSFADPANPEATIVGGGEATITATWSEGASTSFKLKVNVLPVPTVTFSGITDGKKSVALNVESSTETATVDMTVPVVYSSSNENVATVNEDGEVTVLTTGTTEITAKVEAEKGEYKEASATYTLTVTASEASEKSFVEKFSGVSRCDGDCGYTKEAENFIGTDGLFHWTVNSVRLRKGDVIGKGGLRFSTSLEEGSYHLLPDPNYNDGIMEGGIKRIAFTYKEADGGDGVNFEISANSVKRVIKTDPNPGVDLSFAANFLVKENTSLKMFNTKGASVVTIGPISIVPYLLFTTKSDEAFLSLVNEYDVKNVLIDNTDDGTVAYSILTADHQSQISNDGVVTFTDVTKSETITIQAAWTPDGESSATVITTMTLYVDAEYETDKTVKEKFSNYGETGWTTSEENEATKNGDVYDWRTKSTRHKTTDILKDDQQAIWFAQGGYVATADATDNTKVGPAEGGIKRIAFDWNQNGANQTGDDLYISISVDDDEVSAIRRDGGTRPEQPWQYIHNLNVKKNATLKIENKSTASKTDGGRVKIGTIVITPYLLYTTKYDEVKLSKGSYVNTDIINNTKGDGTITFSAAPDNLVELQENLTYPGTFSLLAAGEVTITATWTPDDAADDEIVTTSYVLKINDKEYMDARFATAGNFEEVLGNTFTNAVTYTKGEGTATYSSDDTNVAEVGADGKVTIKGIGTTTIKAHLDATENYFAWDGSYQVIVRTGVADNKKLVESFSGLTKGTSDTKWEGDLKNYFSWNATSARHNGSTGDTIGGAGVAGTVLFAKGQIATDDVIEGGIKYFTFNWKQPYVEAGATLRLTLEAGEESYQQDYIVATDNGSTTHEHLYFAGDMQVKKNVQLILKNESFKTDGGAALTEYGRIAIDKFEIVPYLFYTTKSHTIENATEGATYTNTDLINNIDGGTITYSLIGEGADDIASIDADNGQVTVKTGGVVTVQAKWMPDATNEEEFVTTTYTLTINFPAPDVTFTAPESKNLDETIGETDMHVEVTLGGQPVESPSITYTSSNENVIKITNNGWQIIGIGTTTITANVVGTATYGPASKTADIKVINITPAEGTYWKETFSNLPTNEGYDITQTTVDGDEDVLKWKVRNFERSTSDMVNSEQGIRLNNKAKDTYKNPGYVEYFTEGDVTSQEGGIKRVQFQWRIPGDQDNKKVVFDVKYKEDNQTVVRTLTYNGIAHATVYDYAQNFNLKNNNKLTIAGSTGSESPVIVGPITITPYLLYTTKVVEVTYDLEGENTVDATANLINNIDEGTVTYSLSEGAQATIDGSTITLANVDETITVTATCGEVSTTYTLKVTAKEPDFTLENKTAGALATVCLPKKIDRIENGTLYSISYGDKTSIEFVEADYSNDDAGMPYLVQVAADGDVNFYYSDGVAVDAPVSAEDAKGFVGSLSEGDIEIPNNGTAILISGGRLRIAGAYCVLTQNHAYITTTYLPETATPSSAPRRTIRLYNPDAAPTNLNGLNGTVKPMKVLRDGQFYIIRDTKTYNAQGIEVQ